MYSGEDRIQDDKLSKISIENRSLSFYIDAKETSFKGTFNEMNTELSENFIFPDNTKHPLVVKKFNEDSITVKASGTSPSLKESLKLNIPVEELKSDFKDLINKLKKHHPRLYSYTSEAAFENQAEEILAHLNEDMDPEHFFPLKLFILDKKAYCLSSPEGPGAGIVPGSEIIAINNRPVSQII